MAWRFYARRQTTGEWLHTDVPMVADLTWQLGRSGYATGFVPAAFDDGRAVDGKPFWQERGTTLYAEENNHLKWVGLCSWAHPTRSGRELEFKGLSSAYDLIGFDGRIKAWQPNPYDMVQQLIDNADAQPDGDMGFTIVRDGPPATYAGDEQPPVERPEKVKRRRGEALEHFEDRQEERAKAQEQWDKLYGDRRPYAVAYWEAPYIMDELLELAREIPFDWLERHSWANRDNLNPDHELVLSERIGRIRPDLTLTDGVNIAEVLDPTTDYDRYGNHIVMLGAGEGPKMLRAGIGSRDGRVRTTRYGEAKHVRSPKRLRARARDRFDRMQFSVKLDAATVRDDLAGLELGDRLAVDSRLFEGSCRVFGITRNTRTANRTLTFTDTGGTA